MRKVSEQLIAWRMERVRAIIKRIGVDRNALFQRSASDQEHNALSRRHEFELTALQEDFMVRVKLERKGE